METEKQNGAERPAGYDAPPEVKAKFSPALFDERVFQAIEKGQCRRRETILAYLGLDASHDRTVDNALRRLRSANKIIFDSKEGWSRLKRPKPIMSVKTTTPKKKVSKKRAKVPKKTSKVHHVHCVLPKNLYQHVTTKAKDKTFTRALIDALTKVYGRP